jgi:hypothetical protein
MKPDFSLVINNFSLIDVGIYRCHGKDGQEAEKKYNYRVERKVDNVTNNLLSMIIYYMNS